MKCHKCGNDYSPSGEASFVGPDGELVADGAGKPGFGWSPLFEVCSLCFLYSMFGGMLEPIDGRHVTAIYGINCASERQPEPDWDSWEASGYEGWPPPAHGDTEIPF